MAQKTVSIPYKVWDSLSVTGTSVVTTSSASNILYKDDIGLQYGFAGNATGQIDVQISNDYNPGLVETGGGPNSGTWTSLVQTAPNTLPVTIGSGVTSLAIDYVQSGFAWLRTQWTNSSGTGTITYTFVSKSLG